MTRATTLPFIAVITLALASGCQEHAGPDPTTPEQREPEVGRAEAGSDWAEQVSRQLQDIDDSMSGTLGVHIRRLSDGSRVDHNTGRDWYLASTIKVPVAMAVLEQAEAGRLLLEDTLTLQQSDFVDGSGDLIWNDPGLEIEIGELVAKSVRDSDSTATDMLIRHLGEGHVDSRVRAWVGRGFQPITTILQVRYDVYTQAHPDVADLDNMQIVALRNADAGEPRLAALADTLGVGRDELAGGGFDALFDSYYASGRNSASLVAFADLLEKLDRQDILDAEHTSLLLDHMRAITTGDRRISAGLPDGSDFAQKTGTQIRRACNVGILNPQADHAVVVTACAEDFDDLAQAERAFAAIGGLLSDSAGSDQNVTDGTPASAPQ